MTSDKCVLVAAVIAVGFAGVAVCLTIICCGVVYLRRFDIEFTSESYISYGCRPNKHGFDRMF